MTTIVSNSNLQL